MKINLEQFDESKIPFSRKFTANELNADEIGAGEIEISGAIFKNDLRIEAKGKSTGEFEIDCSRCLMPARFAVNGTFQITYVTLEEYEKTSVEELRNEDFEMTVFDGATIDLSEIAREQVYLNLPSRPLCREDCRGLCSMCGANLNIEECKCETVSDSPFAKLKGFFEK